MDNDVDPEVVEWRESYRAFLDSPQGSGWLVDRFPEVFRLLGQANEVIDTLSLRLDLERDHRDEE